MARALLYNHKLRMNHFELFRLPCQFKLDGSLLSLHFRELQRRFHPDKFATASARDRLLAVQKAALINDAYQTLRDPLLRAQYLLFLHDDAYQTDPHKTMQDTDFLMHQMELREELEEIAASEDAAALLFIFEEQVNKQHERLLVDIADFLNEKSWENAGINVEKLKFLVKLKQEIERIEDRLLG